MKIREFAETMIFAWKESPIETILMAIIGFCSIALIILGIGMIVVATIQFISLF